MRKEGVWSDPRVAGEYERRRFSSSLQRRKQRHDETLVLALLERSGVGPGARILDLPCGTGRMAPALVGLGARVVGADLSLEMMRAGRVAGRTGDQARWVRASAFRLPFADRVFDAALSLRFLVSERRGMVARGGRCKGLHRHERRHPNRRAAVRGWTRGASVCVRQQ